MTPPDARQVAEPQRLIAEAAKRLLEYNHTDEAKCVDPAPEGTCADRFSASPYVWCSGCLAQFLPRALSEARRQVLEEAANFVATDKLCIGAGRRKIAAYLRQRARPSEQTETPQ